MAEAAAPRNRYIPADTVTPDRDVTHAHFHPGDRVAVITGATDGRLRGQEMTVVAPSWHTPTDEDGWRLRNPAGGPRTFITAHPRYLVHVQRYCPDCSRYFEALSAQLLPQMPPDQDTDGGWYSLTSLDQLIHHRDLPRGRR